MRLSIIVPALNEQATIRSTLEALQCIRSADGEIVVVDGGSTDETRTLAAPLADVVLDARRGRATQMNAGASHARGDVLLFLHADTIVAPEHVLRMLQMLDESGRHWGRFDVVIRGRSWWLPVIATSMNVRSRLFGIATGDQAMFVRRSTFERVGRFPEQPLMEDIALSRALKHGAGRPLCLSSRVATSGRRWDQEGALRTMLLMWALRWQYWRGGDPRALGERYRMRTRRDPVH